jgi:hypothetical protein
MKLTDSLVDFETPQMTTWQEAFAEMCKVFDDPARKLTVVAAVTEEEYGQGFFQPFYFEEWRPRLGEPSVVLEYLEGIMETMHPEAKSFRLCYGSLRFPHPFAALTEDDWLLAVVYS